MKVVLKPGGVVLILMMLSGMGYAALRISADKTAPNAVAAPTSAATALWAGIVSSNPTLQNGDFEKGFAPARFLGTPPTNGDAAKAVISGDIGDGWVDNSDWAQITARYSKVTEAGGNMCQHVQLDRVQSGQLQIVQPVALLPGKTYTITCRLRADAQTIAAFGLKTNNGESEPFKTVTVTPEWQTHSQRVKAVTSEYHAAFIVSAPGSSVYIDDVRLEEDPQAPP